MLTALSASLRDAGFGGAAIFDLHPDQIRAAGEAALDANLAARGLAGARRADPVAGARGFLPVITATGAALDEDAVLAAISAAIAVPPPSLAFAWLAEGAGCVALLGALAHRELHGASRRLQTPGSLRWLAATEALFAGEGPFTLRSGLRPPPHEQRAALYDAVFRGSAEGGVFLDEIDGSFTSRITAGLAGDAAARAAAAAALVPPVALLADHFAAIELVSWFTLTVTLPDSPVMAELGLSKADSAARLRGLAEALGLGVAERADALLALAPHLEAAIADGAEAPWAELAPVWAAALDPDQDDDAKSPDLTLAFGGEITLGAEGGFMFSDLLQPEAFRVTDADARVRTPPPALGLTAQRLPLNSTVQIVGVLAAQGALYANVTAPGGGTSSWTKLSNLGVGTNALVGRLDPTDTSPTGPFATWDDGRHTGFTPLWIFGGAGELLLAAEETLTAYLDMVKAARAEGIELVVNSAFRSYPEQKALRALFESGKGAKAAKPGWSNHQSGEALDIAMGMGRGNPSSNVSTWTPTYRWMVKNARRFGFQRTVQDEAWHWERRPATAGADDTFGNFTALKAAGLA